MTATNIVKTMNRKGNAVIGSGCYAVVMQAKNPDKVIKVGNCIDDQWLSYYEKVISTCKNNPYVPQVDSVYIGDNYYVATMEKLKPVFFVDDVYEELADILSLIKEYISGLASEEELLDCFYAADFIDFPSMLLYVCNKLKEYTVYNSTWEASEANDLSSTALDLHQNNVMFREGQLVITDPWADGALNDDNVIMDDWVNSTLQAA